MSKEIDRTEMLKAYILANYDFPDGIKIEKYVFSQKKETYGSFLVEFSYPGLDGEITVIHPVHLLDLMHFWLNHRIP